MRDSDRPVFAAIQTSPGITAKEIVVSLGGPASGRSRQRNLVYGALPRLRDLGLIEPTGWPQNWTSVEREPSEPIHDPEYVEIVLRRLAKIRSEAPERLHHDIDYCCVDLMRALGRVPG